MKSFALKFGLLLSIFTGFFTHADVVAKDVGTEVLNCELEQISPAGQWETGV